MPLMKTIKEQATHVAQIAQDAGKAGQAKLGKVQAKRQLDALYRDLGAAIYAERNGKDEANAEVERLIDAVTDQGSR